MISSLTGQTLLWAGQARISTRKFRSSFGRALYPDKLDELEKERRMNAVHSCLDRGSHSLDFLETLDET